MNNLKENRKRGIVMEFFELDFGDFLAEREPFSGTGSGPHGAFCAGGNAQWYKEHPGSCNTGTTNHGTFSDDYEKIRKKAISGKSNGTGTGK